MKTIQMTLDDALLQQVDQMINKLNMTRSAFIRESLQNEIERLHIEAMEEKHRQGYLKNPVRKGEFDIWYDEQSWGE